ncbi:cytochrome c biogenesis protein CcdA [Bradyrhizobium sp. R2.2-H]|jgi:cytochrome c biogenesis protein CcdA|uniref:cytochrome c biogenesis CcdA family protein n=1 Tax=unclassified Bradyrhizobium TaxID=2631580 RepID=UPI00104366CD|nr:MULTISPECIES: cytochrome c biogenesis CcdA family protein [unclassified Bradyrhizobium]TCU68272.1 cytochrome c biogenesis protein CcdA [Bradyrhizobium sp. Y-H1]TCU70106.1 cytochrome c biogenesis protein CcdA [Bradyrhizobium sp. R2.2-H]
MELATLGLAFVAGVLSIFSPCVLPLVPMVLGTAVSEHRLGPLALAAGLALSFLALGLFVATIGFAIGLDSEFFRKLAASLLIIVGVVLTLPPLQARLALATGPMSTWVDRSFGGSRKGFSGQFGVGLLLGAIWTPCVGPTLGAASVLAAQGKDLGQVSLIMLTFAIGTALPLLVLGFVSREAMMRWRGQLLRSGAKGKFILGLVLAATGLIILTGADKPVEAGVMWLIPEWLTKLATGF